MERSVTWHDLHQHAINWNHQVMGLALNVLILEWCKMIHLSQNLMSHCFALYSQVHAWVESHQSTLSVLPTTASRWCSCCHPSWGISICHWHHRYQAFSLICVPPGLFSTVLASHPKLKGWISSSQALQISLKEYIKILMPADWEVISEHILSYFWKGARHGTKLDITVWVPWLMQ